MSTTPHSLSRTLRVSTTKRTWNGNRYRERKRKGNANKKSQDFVIANTVLDTSLAYLTDTSHPRFPQVVTTKSIAAHNPRRGIFYANELLSTKEAKEFEREFGSLEKVLVIRFPPDISQLLRERLATNWKNVTDSVGDLKAIEDKGSQKPLSYGFQQNGRCYLGLTIMPTPEEDYRMFDIIVEKVLNDPSSKIYLKGILLELPCLLEAYKSLENDLLFKCNDISQVLYVYYKEQEPPFDMNHKRSTDQWESISGLSAGTHRIRSRKFKNFNVFEKTDVSQAEAKLCHMLSAGGVPETTILEASNEFTMEAQMDCVCGEQESKRKNVVSVIRPDNPIFKAALMRVSLREADNHFTTNPPYATRESTVDTPLGNLASHASLEERITFNGNVNTHLNLDKLIPDELSDYLFGDVENCSEDEEEVEPNENMIQDQILEEMDDEDAYFQTIERSNDLGSHEFD